MKKSYECKKCDSSFTSEYLLNRHLNRKVPCDHVIKCNLCNKTFKTTRYLLEHQNRKNPCVSIIQSESVEHKNKLEIIEAKTESKLKIIKATIEVEKIKNERKAINSTVNINSNNTINNNNILNIIQPTIQMNIFNYNNISKHIENNILTLGLDEFGNIIGVDTNEKEKLIKIMELTYNDKNFPETRNLMYHSLSDKFFIIQSNNTWKETDYEDIKETLVKSIQKVINVYLEDYKKTGKNIFGQDADGYLTGPFPDKNMKLRFQLGHCNNFIDKTEKVKKEEKRFIALTKEALAEEPTITKKEKLIEN